MNAVSVGPNRFLGSSNELAELRVEARQAPKVLYLITKVYSMPSLQSTMVPASQLNSSLLDFGPRWFAS